MAKHNANSKPAPSFSTEALQASADNALEQLQEAGENAAALVEAWVKEANAAAVQEAAERAQGASRKAARRGLNVLKSRGVEIPKRRKQKPAASATQPLEEAFLMSPDAAGIWLLGIVQRQSSGRHQGCVIYLRGNQDLLRVENAETTVTRIKGAMEKLAPQAGYKPVPVPVPWARYAIAQARKSHKERGAPEPLGFTTAAQLLSPVPEEAPVHPFDSEGFEFSLEDAKELASSSGALHHEAEFRSWLPSEAAVTELLRNVGSHFPRDEQPEQEAVSQHLKEEMLAATDRYFTPEAREALISRMKDAGVSLLARRGETEALKLAATIQVIANCGLVTDPPQEVPFLRAFFEKAVSFLMARGGGKLNIPLSGPPATEQASPAG